jgi:L-lactate dehydrogenase (cytochrome)
MSNYIVKPVTPDDYRLLAKKRLPRFLFEYIDGGANDQITLASNISDFHQFKLKQQVMRDVGNIDTSATLLGQQCTMPIALAPVGMAGMMARRGEVQGARVAQALGVPFTASTVGICSVDEIQAATHSPFWFQLYMLRDRGVILTLLERAQAAGCTTLVFTVDLAVAGMRHADTRNGMLVKGFKSSLEKAYQIATHPSWVVDVAVKGKPLVFGNLTDVVADPTDLNSFKQFLDAQFDPTVTWKDIAWLRSVWKGKLIIKGVMEVDDALAAVDCGADAVLVSNHGGRQLDSVASTISKLPNVVAAVGGQTEVYMDGGIRSGVDVVKAVALGAKGVFIGRPWICALAAKGEAGLTDQLALFQREISVTMALMGVNKIEDITPDMIEY